MRALLLLLFALVSARCTGERLDRSGLDAARVEEPALHGQSCGREICAVLIAEGAAPGQLLRWRSITALPTAGERLRVELEPGSSILGREIRVEVDPGLVSEVELEQSYETSLTIRDEGAHRDLVGWLHHRSAWTQALRAGPDLFQTRLYSESERRAFPDVRGAAVVEHLRSGGAPERWLALARSCASAQETPCAVDISAVSLRITTRQGGLPSRSLILDFVEPMGC